MLISKLLRAKRLFTISTGEQIVDLISSTFNFGESNTTMGPTVVNEDEIMRPDRLSEKLYSSQNYWDVILKFNGISNPFSLDFGEMLFAPSVGYLEKLVSPAKTIIDKGTEPAKKNESTVIKPKSKKDERMLAAIRTRVSEVLPPNINQTGAKNVKVENGRVILGPDMTTANTSSSNQTINRARVQAQLQNNQTL